MPKGQAEKTEKCPHCGQMFTAKGLPGHIAFTHNKGAAGGAEKKEGKGKEGGASAAGQQRSAGGAGNVVRAQGDGDSGDRDDLDHFIFGK